jgi:putative methyltransferase (TIGR04325 family)
MFSRIKIFNLNNIRSIFAPKKREKIIKTNLEKLGWIGDYSSWEAAKKDCIGYDDTLILETCKNSLLKIVSGEFAYERDSVLFDEIQYSWPVLAILLRASIENSNSLVVLDFGGSLGSSYYQNKEFLRNIKKIEWCIVEQFSYVDYGKLYFENENLKFYYTIDQCINNHKVNFVLLSSVIQYIESPEKLLMEINNLDVEYIVFDRTGIVFDRDLFLTKQIVPSEIYGGSYPCWFLSENYIIKHLKNFELMTTFNSFCDPIDLQYHNGIVSWKGLIFKNKEK